jgi:hypothetical protein
MAKKNAKKPKSRGGKAAKIKNLPAKSLSGDDVRAVKGGDGTYSKVSLEYKPQKADGTLDAGVTSKYDLRAQREG